MIPDQTCVDAIGLAQEWLVGEVGGASVGEHRSVQIENSTTVSHLFVCLDAGYVGWNWSVTISKGADDSGITLDEIVLLPGEGALVAPAWVPWQERLQPGDLGPGDVLPPVPDDVRLVPGYAESLDANVDRDDPTLTPLWWALGLGKERVLSVEGRDEAADRWKFGETGPRSKMAKQAPGPCSTCGFSVPLAGVLGQQFAVCTNEMSPADAKVVALDFGCGAHSQVEQVTATFEVAPLVAVSEAYDEFDLTAEPEPEAAVEAQPEPEAAVEAQPETEPALETEPAVDPETEPRTEPEPEENQ